MRKRAKPLLKMIPKNKVKSNQVLRNKTPPVAQVEKAKRKRRRIRRTKRVVLKPTMLEIKNDFIDNK